MLRKRQRREAALKAAEKEVNATLGVMANRDAMRCTDADPGMKGGDVCSDVEYSVRTGCATPSGLSSAVEVATSSGVGSPFTMGSPLTPRRDAKLQISTLVTGSPGSAVEACAPWTRRTTGREVWAGHADQGGEDGRLGKVRRLNEDGAGGNALAALAMAASSVPPSPLTPESRVSAMSRSRSVSPERMAWGAVGRGFAQGVGSVHKCEGGVRKLRKGLQGCSDDVDGRVDGNVVMNLKR